MRHPAAFSLVCNPRRRGPAVPAGVRAADLEDIETHPLADVPAVLERLARGEIKGRAVLRPRSHVLPLPHRDVDGGALDVMVRQAQGWTAVSVGGGAWCERQM